MQEEGDCLIDGAPISSLSLLTLFQMLPLMTGLEPSTANLIPFAIHVGLINLPDDDDTEEEE